MPRPAGWSDRRPVTGCRPARSRHRRSFYPLGFGLGLGLLLVALGSGCGDTPPVDQTPDQSSDQPAGAATTPRSAPPKFVEVSHEAGITHRHHKPVLDSKLDNIDTWISSVGASAAAGDFDKDGWIDLYVIDSRKGTPNYLYRNNGDGTFTDVAATAGVADLNDDGGTGMDCVWGDYDNDGWDDLYIVRWGTDRFFHNNGDGTFTEVTSRCFEKRDGTPGTDWANGNAAIFFDYNLDGRLDIYVGNYFTDVDLWNLQSTRILHEDFERARNGGENFLYRQEADGTFTEVARELGLEDPGWTLAVGSADVDNDGWPDLYCANDFGPDQLFINTKDGSFRNVSDIALGYDTKKGMNVDFGDFNNDGWLDIYIANITTAEYLREGNMLWYNSGPGPDGTIRFLDIAAETETWDGGWAWGAKFFDADNDTHLDLIGVNGFITDGEGEYWYDLASWTVKGQDSAEAANWPTIGGRSFSGSEQTRFWHNTGQGSFIEKAAAAGLGGDRDGRGVVIFDYDNDGDLDIYVACQGQEPYLYRNETSSSHHWLKILLEVDPTTGVNLDGIGTRLTLVTSDGQQIREREGGCGYSAQSDPRLHFGLGDAEKVELLEVRWPDGGLQYLESIAADQIITVKQDPDVYAARMEIDREPPRPWSREEVSDDDEAAPESETPDVDPEELDRILSELEDQIRSATEASAATEGSTMSVGYSVPAMYRAQCVLHGQHDRAIRFFEKLVKESPDDVRLRTELAVAYVDKIPTRGGLAAIVSKGTLARKSLDELNYAIEQNGGSWILYYCRGMNHLYWPRALRHSDDAVADFSRCLEIQNRSDEPAAEAYYLRTYIALGDAYAKAKMYMEARAVWNQGREVFPASEELAERLRIADDSELLDFVEERRSLERPIDTDLSFME